MRTHKKSAISKKSVVALSLLLVTLLLLSALSYAWFRNIIRVPGASINTGKFQYEFAGYYVDRDGTLKTDFAYSTQVDSDTFDPETGEGFYQIPTTQNLIQQSGASTFPTTQNTGDIYYVVHKLENSVDLEISIKLDASLDGLENIGGLEYTIYEISGESEDLVASSDNVLDAIKDTELLGNPGLSDTTIRAEQNFIKLRTEIRTEQLKGDTDYWCFRLSYKLKDRATLGAYTEQDIQLSANLCVAQVGGLENMESQPTILVKTESQLETALATYITGATIRVQGDIEYNKGDVIINRPLTLEIIGATLTIKGDLRFVYADSDDGFKIDTSQRGQLRVQRMDGTTSGGNIFLDIPGTNIEIFGMGMSEHSDVMVQGKVSVDASYDRGLVITRSRICNLQEKLTPIYLRNTTSVDVYRFTEVGQLLADTSSALYRVKLVNNGTIDTINLLGFADIQSTASTFNPKIYIENHGSVTNPILLPRGASPYFSAAENEEMGNPAVESGNTMVVQFPGASSIQISTDTSSIFKNEDIRVESIMSLVDWGDTDEPSSDNTRITVHYMALENDATTQTLQGILEHANDDKQPGSYIASLSQIVGMRIICYGTEKSLTAADYQFIRENMKALQYLDLEQAYSQDGKVPNNALQGLESLSEVKMSESDTTWGSALFDKTAIKEIYLPVNIRSINSQNNANNSLRNSNMIGGYIPYIHVSFYETVFSLPASSYIFVPDDTTVETYRASTKKVFREATRYEVSGGDIFVRLSGEDCEFVTYVSESNTWWESIFDNKTITHNGITYVELDMSTITLATRRNVVSIDPYAFYGKLTAKDAKVEDHLFVIRLGSTVTSIGEQAFSSSSSLLAVYGDAVTFCGNQAFYSCSKLTKIVLPALNSIGVKSTQLIQSCPSLVWLETGVINREINTSAATVLTSGVNQLKLYLVHPNGETQQTSLSVPSVRTENVSNNSAVPTVRVIVPSAVKSRYTESTTAKVAPYDMRVATVAQLQLYPSIHSNDHVSVPDFIHGYTDNQNVLISCLSDRLAVAQVFAPTFFNQIDVIGHSAYFYTAFYSEEGKSNILTIPSSVSYLERYAFAGSNKLYHTLQLNMVQTVAERAFYNNNMLFVYGNNTHTIGYHAFMGAKMSYVELRGWRWTLATPESTFPEYQYGYYFRNCTKLKYAYLGPMDKVGSHMFSGASSVRVLFIDSTGRATSGVQNLASVSLPSTATVIHAGKIAITGHSGELLLESFSNLMYTDLVQEAVELEVSGLGTVQGSISLPQNVTQMKSNGNIKFLKSLQSRPVDAAVVTYDYTTPGAIYRTEETVDFLGATMPKYSTVEGSGTLIGVIDEIAASAYVGTSFSGCQTLTIAPSVRTIRDNAFYGCAAVTVDLSNVTYLAYRCFYQSTMSTVIANKVETVCTGAFSYTTYLKKVELPSYVTQGDTGNYGYFEKSAVEEVLLGPNTKMLGRAMFWEANKLKKVTIQSSKVPTDSDGHAFDIAWNSEPTTQVTLVVRKSADYLSGGTKTHWNYVDASCITYFDNVHVENGIEYYWNETEKDSPYAIITAIRFQETAELIDGVLKIPSVVSALVQSEITGEDGQKVTVETTVDYPVTNIAPEAMEAVTSKGYSVLELPYGLEVISFSPDALPASLMEFRMTQHEDPDYQYHFQIIDGVIYNETGTALLLYPKGKAAENFEISESVTSIANSAFRGSTRLDKVTVLGNVAILDSAFSESYSLTEIYFAQETPSLFIGRDIFDGSTALRVIYVPTAEAKEAYIKNVIFDRSIAPLIAVMPVPDSE